MNYPSIGSQFRVLTIVLAVAAGGVTLLSGCASNNNASTASGTLSPSERAQVGKALAKLDDQWCAAAATKDARKVGSFYAENAIAYPPGEPMASGQAAAEQVWARYFKDPSFEISWKSDRAEAAASGDIGYTSGAYQCAYRGPDGRPVREQGKFLCVWRKQADGSWKAIHDMWNTDTP